MGQEGSYHCLNNNTFPALLTILQKCPLRPFKSGSKKQVLQESGEAGAVQEGDSDIEGSESGDDADDEEVKKEETGKTEQLHGIERQMVL